MRKLLFVFAVSGCAVSSTPSTTLVPLVDFTPTTTTTVFVPIENEMWVPNRDDEIAYIEAVTSYVPHQGDEELLMKGYDWCEIIRSGWTRTDVVSRVSDMTAEGANGIEELAVVNMAVNYLCQDQEYKLNP